MPEEIIKPTPKQFPTPLSLIAWIRDAVYKARISGKEPISVNLPVWAEAILAASPREMIGDKACDIMQQGVRTCLLKFYGVSVVWDAADLEVVLSQE
jgi:hypothetical protein